MCSENNCNLHLLLKRDNNEIKEDTICKKCLEKKATILLRNKDAYCQDCFLIAATHKFRATLGKSKIVRPSDSVLIAHSGKASSTALLHLIRAGMHESVHKRLVFKTSVLYIDGNYDENLHESQVNRMSSIKNISDQVNNFGFTGYTTTLSQILNPGEPDVQPLDSMQISTEFDEAFLRILNNLSSLTSKEDLLQKLRQRLIVSVARKLNCNKVFLGDNMNKLSVKILENVSLGRAAHLSLDVSFVDNRYPDLLLLRPMKDFTTKELNYYIDCFKLQIIDSENLTTSDSALSIRQLTNKFIGELEEESNSTVSTVFRIGQKLGSNSKAVQELKDDKLCVLCEARLDTDMENKEICTIDYMSFSRRISEKNMNNDENDEIEARMETLVIKPECNGDIPLHMDNIINVKSSLDFFCYGCRLIIMDFQTAKDIPMFLSKKVLDQISIKNKDLV